MFFLKELGYRKKFVRRIFKKVYVKKKFNKLKNLNIFKDKKKIFKRKILNIFLKKKIYISIRMYSFFSKFYNIINRNKSKFFMSSFFFFNIINRKNNIFLNITKLNNHLIYKNTLKSLKITKKKKDLFKKNTIYLFFIRSLKAFYKGFILSKVFKMLPNFYILSKDKQSLVLKRLSLFLLKPLNFIINVLITPELYRLNKYIFAIRGSIKFLRKNKKIKILSVSLRYKNKFNGCRIRKLKRI
jgi:hypothetical protein